MKKTLELKMSTQSLTAYNNYKSYNHLNIWWGASYRRPTVSQPIRVQPFEHSNYEENSRAQNVNSVIDSVTIGVGRETINSC